MRTTLFAALAVVTSMTLVLPQASALTPRLEFNDNHFTYLNFGEIQVCGDHLCHPDEWDHWITQLMQNQRKNAGAIPEDSVPTYYSLKQIAYNENSSTDPSSGEITKVTTFDMGNNEFSSFVSISYTGYLDINHIILSQKDPGVSIHRAWISPQWNSTITSDHISFDSRQTALYHDKTINVVIVTIGKPTFSLGNLSSSQII
jgi:hypothetical protein